MGKRILYFLPLIFIATLVIADLATDYEDHRAILHILIEGIATLIFLLWFVPVWTRKFKAQQKNAELLTEISQSQEAATRWQTEAQAMLGWCEDRITTQFERWHFSKAEKEVAVQLMRGLSIKEIANERRVSEKTVRQQASDIYSKAKLSGRNELAAFFLKAFLRDRTPLR